MKLARYVAALPVLSALGILIVYPVLSVLRLSFFESNYLREHYVGIGNYLTLLADPKFWNAVVNSCIYGLAFMVGEVAIGAPFALAAFDLPKGWRDSLRMAIFIPTTAAGIIISQVWLWIFSPFGGLANWALSLVHLGPVGWLSTRLSATGVVSLVIAATMPGAGVIILMAALAGVPREILEASVIDGASPWQTRFLVAMPYIRTTLLLVTLISFIAGAQVWEFVYAITSGGPAGSTQSMIYFVYETGLLRSKYGLGAAASVVLVAVVSVWSFGVSQIQRRWR